MAHISGGEFMRTLILLLFACLITGALLACNSNETLLSQKLPTQTPPAPASSPADNARRITAAELHKLWEKNEVVIIDTRAEPAFKQERIKGAISMPTGTVLQHINELPKNKLIAAYCT
jgi:3-mercaptopyruvate sulfurtransferase SseA